MDRLHMIPFAMLVLALASDARATGTERTLPSCALSSFDGDRRFDLEQLKGNVLWVDFWVSWCDTCAASLAFLNGLDREFRAQGLHVIGINLDEDPEDAREFLASHPVGFALATDPSGRCPKRFGAPGMPSAYLIDRSGVIRHEQLGFQAGDAAKIRALVSGLIAADADVPQQPGVATGAR